MAVNIKESTLYGDEPVEVRIDINMSYCDYVRLLELDAWKEVYNFLLENLEDTGIRQDRCTREGWLGTASCNNGQRVGEYCFPAAQVPKELLLPGEDTNMYKNNRQVHKKLTKRLLDWLKGL